MNQIYLDSNASSQMERGAERALLLLLSGDRKNPGNASSIHWAGRKAKVALDQARDAIAAAFGIDDPDELLFTGSATEAINTALKGFYFHHQAEGRLVRLITSAVEHEATLGVASFLASLGVKVESLPVCPHGQMNLRDLEQRLAAGKGEATLVSLLAANNETGVVFPWEEAAKLSKAAGAYFHLDAVQAPGKLPGFTLQGSAVDLASFSAHKIGGMKGVGALMVRKGVPLTSLIHGGAQERKRRAGTVNVPGVATFGAAAAALASRDLAKIDRLRAGLEAQVLEQVRGTSVQGEGKKRLVNTSHFLFDGVRGESLLMGLDLEGFAVSSGSACNSGSVLPSHVLLAMGFDKLTAQSAIRVSLGPENTEEEIGLFVAALVRVIERIRAQNRPALRQ